MGVQLSCVDLFSGAGGLSAGLRSAGFELAAALESVPRFAATHAANFPKCSTVVASAAELSARDFASIAGLRPGSVDLVAGGPPCQTFSTIGAPKIKHVSRKD